MPLPYAPSPPNAEQVQLRLTDTNLILNRWVHYEFTSDYLIPAAAFNFVVADPNLPQEIHNALNLGARVRLEVNSIPLCDGHIDSVENTVSRNAGTVWTIAGRERIALAVDAVADPTWQFKEGTSLADFLKALYAPYGWPDDSNFAIDNAASRAATRGLRGMPMTRGGRMRGPKALKSFVLHQLKPYDHEGVHEFAKRVTDRHGLHIRCSEDGERIIVDTPNFTQDPSYELRLIDDGKSTNVLDSSVRFDMTNQPTAIIADGVSNSTEYGHGRIKSIAVNPYFGYDNNGHLLDAVTQLIAQHPKASQVVLTTQPFKRRVPNTPPRIMYLHDESSKTQSQLDNFVRRQMSEFMMRGLTASYTVEGHGQMVNGQFVPWFVDTVANVQDSVADLHERMWVKSVHYSRSRQSGTHTRVELLRLNSLPFDQPG